MVDNVIRVLAKLQFVKPDFGIQVYISIYCKAVTGRVCDIYVSDCFNVV